MAKLPITSVSTTIQKKVALSAVANTNKSSVLSLVNTGARQYPVGSYVALWDKDTYATPNLDANARIGVVTARTNSTVSVDWGQFGTAVASIAGRPTLAVVTMGTGGKAFKSETDITRAESDVLSLTVAASKTANATTESGLDQVITVDGVVVTLPTPAPGLRLDFLNGGASDGAVGFQVNPGSGISILGLNSAATANKGVINTKANARVGDRLSLVGGSATLWYARVTGNFDREP